MARRVAIIGLGLTAIRPASEHQSFKEMMFEAAQRAYDDAGIEAREIESFVTCAEDFSEGISIFDEYTPDQLGAVMKPMHTLTQDGLYGIADGVMQIRAGVVEMVAVEAHSKNSNLENPNAILSYALDPVLNRPLDFNPHAIAALEMNAFLQAYGISQTSCAAVVAKNHAHALKNIAAAYPLQLCPEDIAASPYLCYPLRQAEIARRADGCVVVVLASETRAAKARSQPVWVRGVGFANDSPTLESRDWTSAPYIRIAAAMAYRHARINDPMNQIDLFEVDDSYAYKELQHLIALGLDKLALTPGNADAAHRSRINISGGSLGMGHTLEANGLYRLAEIVHQLRGAAGSRQLDNAKVGLAQSWRGVPTTSGAVAILGVEP